MSKQKGDHGVSELKEAFDQLSLDDKAAFLMKAVFSTASAALDEIGERIEDLVNAVTAVPAEEDTAPGEPEKPADEEEPAEGQPEAE